MKEQVSEAVASDKDLLKIDQSFTNFILQNNLSEIYATLPSTFFYFERQRECWGINSKYAHEHNKRHCNNGPRYCKYDNMQPPITCANVRTHANLYHYSLGTIFIWTGSHVDEESTDLCIAQPECDLQFVFNLHSFMMESYRLHQKYMH